MKTGTEYQNHITESIRTKEERSEYTAAIEMFAGRLFRVSHEEAAKLVRAHVPECAQMITQEAVRTLADDPEALRYFFEILEKKLSTLRVLRIDIAVTPTETLIENIFSWLRREVGKGIVLDIMRDREIVGGARFIFEGRYKEYTVSQEVNATLKRNREDIFKKFLHHAT